MSTNRNGKQVLVPSNISSDISNEQETVLETVKNKQESLSQEELITYYMKLAKESKRSKYKMTILEILEFYETHHKFSIPRKVLIDQSFCRYMLRNGITKEAICDLLLTKDVQINVTSCNTKPLMRRKIHNKDELKARIGLALSLKELSCDLINTCLNSSDCLERLVLNENPSCYFVATKDKAFMKKLLQLPGVAVIGSRRGNLMLKEPSAHQTKFVENKLKGREVADLGECVLEQIGLTENSSRKRKGKEVADVVKCVWEQIGLTENSSRKRKNLSYADDETEMEKRAANNRRGKQKLQNKTEVEGKEVGECCVLEQIESKLGKACLTKNSSGKRKNLSFADDESDGEGVTSNRRVKHKLQKKIEVENDLVTLDEEPRCRTLFMGRLNFSISEDDVRYFFSKVARVNEVRFSTRKKGARFGHVEFYTAEAARRALKLNGQKLRGHVVHLDYAEKRPNLAKKFASGIARNGTRDGSSGEGRFYGRGRHWGFGAGRGRHGGFGAGRVRHGGFGAGRGRHEGRDW